MITTTTPTPKLPGAPDPAAALAYIAKLRAYIATLPPRPPVSPEE
jgi:hypothetical protein